MKLPPILGALALALAAPLPAQTPVYTLPGETGGPFTYLTVSQGTEYADSAHLAGTDRVLDQAVVTVYSNVARQGSVTLSFYTAVPDENEYEGPVGQPGVTPGNLAGFRPSDTPLWSSGPLLFSFQDDGSNNLNLNELVFSGINTLVPDDIFWTLTFTDISNFSDGGAFGPKLEDAALLGPVGAETDPSRFYLRDPGGEWIPVWLATNAPPTSTLSIQLTAVPEPSAALLGILGVAGLIRRRRTA
ncbi:hypothetical protein OJ996_03445 [Luteolibacter sp. GHJ8]|uniref:PEP-CTERM sorting domain-containing protein n=1 Tax=Luteolibacter rhizosphaerae TaxID=2989719 RepID=A0ABT3FZE3_9BACT|nr:hypothetical protein [Luteolibacter rhizosphaerae]MCW1912614.1 hypothetical protein [Luteolibacter rhizosphaerae]